MVWNAIAASALFAAAGLLNVTHVWVESPLTPVFPSSERPGGRGEQETRLYMARGERASFQIAVRSTRQTVEDIRVEADPIAEGIGAPDVYRVGYVEMPNASSRRAGAWEGETLWPDPLLPYEPFDAPPLETQALWVTYHAGDEASPGVYRGEVELIPAQGRKHTIDVTIEVFAFDLPEVAALETLFRLDRHALADAFGWNDNQLDTWKPVYDALAPYRVSYTLWDTDLGALQGEDSPDPPDLREHLAYVAEEANMRTLDLGHSLTGIGVFPPPGESPRADPIRPYFRELGDWLSQEGLLRQALVQPMPASARRYWNAARRANLRVNVADSHIRRLWQGPFHPFMERHTDVWAVPLRQYDRAAHRRLREGFSLASPLAHAANTIEASSSGGQDLIGYETAPSDGYDGSPHTYWIPEPQEMAREGATFEIHFEEPVRTNQLRVDWLPEHEGTGVEVRTSFDSRTFNRASVEWDHDPALTPFDESWSEGRFDMEKTFVAIRFTFPRASNAVGVATVSFGGQADTEDRGSIGRKEVWLAHDSGRFPDFQPDAAYEARLFPWVCWGHNASGLLGSSLTSWPREWAAKAEDPPLEWSAPAHPERFLFYPGPDGLMPSIRAQLLRDGIADYAYLAALYELVDGKIAESGAEDALTRRFYRADLSPGDARQWAEEIPSQKVELGRAITRLGRGEEQ
ncbi:MAG: hypothetical protein ACLFV4_00720 [Candidatus Hydrogenedentota bacterium]